MTPQFGPALRRSYQLARRLRRFRTQERYASRLVDAPPRARAELLTNGFLSDKRILYPGVMDPSVRCQYVDDLTTLRFRMFNGKSGALLTQKDVLLPVLRRHSSWPFEHRILWVDPEDDRPIEALHRQLGTDASRAWAVLAGEDSTQPRVFVPAAVEDPALVPRGRLVLHATPASVTNESLQPGVFDPTVIQIATYWDAAGPFIGHAVALRGGVGVRRGWPEIGPGLHVAHLDPSTGAVIDHVSLGRVANEPLSRTASSDDHHSIEAAAVTATAAELLELARRFPNLQAIAWNLLYQDGRLHLLDAENRLDVVHRQLFGPLLADPRLAAVYSDAGMRRRSRADQAPEEAPVDPSPPGRTSRQASRSR